MAILRKYKINIKSMRFNPHRFYLTNLSIANQIALIKLYLLDSNHICLVSLLEWSS